MESETLVLELSRSIRESDMGAIDAESGATVILRRLLAVDCLKVLSIETWDLFSS